MKKIKVISFMAMLLVLGLSCRSNANIIVWTEGDYTIPYPGWSAPDRLDTYNTVNVTILSSGVSTFNMHDSSKLIMSDGFISELNLYNNTTASIFGFDDIQSVWIEPESTALVKLYAVEIWHDAYDPEHQQIGFYWLDNPLDFDTINLIGSSTYSHIQFIPEPATITLLIFGGLLLLTKDKKLS